MDKYNWEEDFRPDGYRGHCPDCNQTFNMNHGETLRTAMVRHYQERHSDRVLKAEVYMNMIETDVARELANGDCCSGGKIGGGPHSNGSRP